jgi:hypothetical protein
LYRELGNKQGSAPCLEAQAALAGSRAQGERAARLFGAAAALRDLAAARAHTDELAWAAAWEAGYALSPDEAVTTADQGYQYAHRKHVARGQWPATGERWCHAKRRPALLRTNAHRPHNHRFTLRPACVSVAVADDVGPQTLSTLSSHSHHFLVTSPRYAMHIADGHAQRGARTGGPGEQPGIVRRSVDDES